MEAGLCSGLPWSVGDLVRAEHGLGVGSRLEALGQSNLLHPPPADSHWEHSTVFDGCLV